MKRKIITLMVLGLVIASGAVIASGSLEFADYNPLQLLTHQKKAVSLSAAAEQQAVTVDRATTTAINQNAEQNAQPVTSTTIAKNEQNRNQLSAVTIPVSKKIIGQWGYMNTPSPMGRVIGRYQRNQFIGSSTTAAGETQTFVIKLYNGRFTGKLYTGVTAKSVVNSNAASVTEVANTASIPIIGVYSISNGYITSFWTIHPTPTVSSSVSQHYDGWFFGEIA